MKIIITGGLGFIGSNMVRRILDGKYPEFSEVVLIDSQSYSATKESLDGYWFNNRLTFVKSDICDKFIMGNLLSDADGIINFAAESHVDRSIESPDIFAHSNYSGVQNILEGIRKSGRKKLRFLQVSTDEVYGSIKSGSWKEDFPLGPNSPYSATKAAAELLCFAYSRTYGIDVIVTRSSNNYGPFQFPEKIIPLFATNLLLGDKIPVYGSGENVRDWIHVDDNCDAIYRVFIGGKAGEAYNIGGGNEISNIQLTHFILKHFKLDESSILYVADRKGHDFRYSVDCTKTKNELGWKPKIEFEIGLQNTLEWYKKNTSWWEKLKKNG
jgi:dTDP-glucose 4,6-dehydratase